MYNNFKPLHQLVAEKLIEELKAGTSVFQKPWNDQVSADYTLPLNPTTGKNYRGMNALWLAMQNRPDPRWMTLKQASFQHWTVEKGAKATLISFAKTSDIRPLFNENGERAIDENGKPQTTVVQLDKPVITNAWVFNAEQIKGIPSWQQALEDRQSQQKWSPVERAEKIIIASQAKIAYGGNEAYYDLSADQIQLPQKEQFDSATKYYATLLHELGHWTGHQSRMNREMNSGFGSEQYAREELRAEIASLMMASEIQIGHNFGQHAAYVDSWIEVLQNDPHALYEASRDAQKIFDYVLEIEHKREQALEQNTEKNKNKLAVDDVVSYNQTTYKVIEAVKGKGLKIEDLVSGHRFKLTPKDGLYASLVEARNNPQAANNKQKGLELAQENTIEQDLTPVKLRR